MALLQSIHLEHLPASHILRVALFHSVTNAAYLQQQLLDGNAEFEYAFIDASAVSTANGFS
jgi:EKC/KEOPS complex subunit CGI121/TPRKB